jgi:small conductance mechanosensitive channel
LGSFPDTRWLQILLLSYVIVLIIIFGTYLIIKASPVIINWFAINIFDNIETQTSVQRNVSRAITFSHILKGIVIFILAGIGILLIFQSLDFPIIIVLVGLGIISLTVSFGGQNLIKDIISGILILLEDQYAIGDIIYLDDTKGYVEELNFRVTQLRDTGGRLSTIPNSRISIVHNLTKDWASIDLRIKLHLDNNLSQALQLLKEVAYELKKNPEWGDKILDSATVLGVNSVAQTEVELMVRMKTLPRKQWSVAREFCYRLKENFERENFIFNATITSKSRS